MKCNCYVPGKMEELVEASRKEAYTKPYSLKAMGAMITYGDKLFKCMLDDIHEGENEICDQ